MSELHHGGRLNQAVRDWGIPRDQWLDLSTGINPVGWPVPALPAAVWQRLPEPDDDLERQLQDWFQAPSRAALLAVPGSQWAIETLPRLRAPCRVGVPEPGYAEHRHHWASAGHQLVPVPLAQLDEEDDRWLEALDVLVWINPNNPGGRTWPAAALRRWHRQLAARGGWLVVDEAFADGQPALSLGPATGVPGLVVLKSLGKFFGLAGVRAGAVAADQALIDQLAARLGPWALSGPARWVMARALADWRWQQATRQRLGVDSERLGRLLRDRGLTVTGSTLLFQTVHCAGAAALAQRLASGGILVRAFPPSAVLRFGLPGKKADWQRLDDALSQWQAETR